MTFVQIEHNSGHAHARNVALDYVDTPYVMFLDADDQLASYAIDFYLNHVNGLDGLIAPIHKFTNHRPQYVDKDKIRLEYLSHQTNPNSFYENIQFVIYYSEQLLLKPITLDSMKV